MSIGISGKRKEVARELEIYAHERREFLKKQRNMFDAPLYKRGG